MGAFVVLVVVQLSVLGSYLPPVLKGVEKKPLIPPQTIISVPVQTAVCPPWPSGGPEVAVQVLSVQPAATDGSVYPIAGGDIEAISFSALAIHDANGSFGHSTVPSFNRSFVLARTVVA